MKIAASELAMQANHLAQTRHESGETLRAWRGERPDFEGMRSAVANISEAARTLFSDMAAVLPEPTFEATAGQAQAIEAASDAADNDPFLSMIKSMVEMLTGEKVRVFDMQSFSAELRHVESRATASAERVQPAGDDRAGWGMEYDAHHLREEFEQTSFSASGVVRTADGQEISFALDLQMTRYFREESHVSLRAGDAVRKDPLVINFGGTAAQLAGHAGQRFRFDIDGDGQADWLPLFASGSGYLALDLDGNDRVDSGRELFGPQTGRGFEELARHDDDGNGWIDENDAAFEKLRVWTPAAEGPGTLLSLAELDIGALALAHVPTPFGLRGPANADLGTVKNGSIYLTEKGHAGSIQEIDLTV
jgi:hypothetical protein